MSLQFIFGGSGSGKSHYLYERILREAGENPALNYMVLVPEQFTMQTQKDLVLMSDKKGILNIDVLSFGRLAYRIFEETGGGNAPVLDDEGKNLILRKIAGDVEPKLKMLRGNMKRLGYISEVKSVLSEFDQYDIGIQELDQVMDHAEEYSSFYYKMQDMKILYEAFRDYLKDRYITKEEILDVLCRMVPQSELLKKSIIVLDGFTGFTPVQNRLLAELLKVCRKVIVTVTIAESEDPYTYAHPWQMFGMSKHTVSSLTRIVREVHAEQEKPVWMSKRPYPRFQHSPGLAFLEKHLFRYKRAQFTDDQDQIHICSAANPREEAVQAAAMVRRLVRTKGYRYREIGVIVTDMDGYGDYLEQAFLQYEIPVFMDHKRSILLNSFVEYVRSILEVAEQNFTYDSVFRFLRAGYGPFAEDETDILDNYCVALGIRGYKKWQERWVRKTSAMTETDLEMLNHLRVQFVEMIDELMFVLKQRKKTVRDITEALYHFLEKEGLQQRLKNQENAFTEAGELALAKEYAQVYGVVIGLFDKFVELLGDEPVNMKEYRELLDAGLNEAKIGVIPPGLDQVIVGDVERTRLKDIKALLVLGVNDAYLPGSLLRTGLLSERDREHFQKEHLNLTPGGREQAYIQKFYLYLNLTKPEQELYLFYSKSSSDGKAMRPAYLIGEVRKLFPKLEVTDGSARRLAERELTPETAVEELIQGLRMKSNLAGESWMELYSWYLKNPEWAEEIRRILDASFFSYQPEWISKEAARRLYGEKFTTSISRMERFSACAFAHFLGYGLRLKEREVYEFQPMDLGNVFHEAIERYSKKAEQEGGWTKTSTERRQELVKESLGETITDYGNSVLYNSARNEYMIVRMERLLDRTVWALTEQISKGDFVPEGYELSFGYGKIDRMDLCRDEDKVYVKITDYKTGQKKFDISSLYQGLQLQLMVYMNAAVGKVQKEEPGKQVIPSGVFYYRIQDPMVAKEHKTSRQEQILKELRLDGMVNLEADSLRHLDHVSTGDSMVVRTSWNKNGSLSKYSQAMEPEEFHTLMSYANEKSRLLREEIRNGNTEVKPYRKGQETGCDYCDYRHICGFDDRLPGYRYRNLEKLSQEETMNRMRLVLEQSVQNQRKEEQPWA